MTQVSLGQNTIINRNISNVSQEITKRKHSVVENATLNSLQSRTSQLKAWLNNVQVRGIQDHTTVALDGMNRVIKIVKEMRELARVAEQASTTANERTELNGAYQALCLQIDMVTASATNSAGAAILEASGVNTISFGANAAQIFNTPNFDAQVAAVWAVAAPGVSGGVVGDLTNAANATTAVGVTTANLGIYLGQRAQWAVLEDGLNNKYVELNTNLDSTYSQITALAEPDMADVADKLSVLSAAQSMVASLSALIANMRAKESNIASNIVAQG